MTRDDRPFRTWLAWELGCLGELLFWWVVAPFAAAFLVLVLFTATLRYVRAKQRAMEQELLASNDADDAWGR